MRAITKPSTSGIRRGEGTDKQVLEFVLACYHAGMGWWGQTIPGTRLSMLGHVLECRKRYGGRRSVASLDSDVKSKPFPRSSNIGIGAEQIFGEFLIPVFLANTRDLEPRLQVVDEQTEEVDDARTAFHESYQRKLMDRKLVEYSTREVLTVGSCYHKGNYETVWTQREVPMAVYAHPLSRQPIMELNPQTGQVSPKIANPTLPEALQPRDAMTGRPLPILQIPSVDYALQREGPTFSVVTAEHILFPPKATEVDPQAWDWVIHTFEVSPWWFLGRDGDPWQGKLQNLDKLWKWMGLNPQTLYSKPSEATKTTVKLAEYHGPFAVSYSGQPVEIIALVVPEANLLLGWRVTIFPRRPFFHRQVWNRGEFPLGIGIPESVRGERDYLDASVNQDADSGNLYNHPPMLFSDLAMLDDEEYELLGAGTRWILRDINGAKMLPMAPTTRNPIERENWILSMMQRKWGVTDLNLSAPTSSLSPNVSTATGVVSILNQTSIKFGHLTKRLAETDSQEYQFGHECFATMLANPVTVVVEGKPQTVTPEQRQEFFSSRYRVRAVGNGITTNPIMRQEILGRTYGEMIASKNPFLVGDLALLKELTEDLLEARGLKYALKDPQALQQSQLFLELMQTPAGQAILPAAIQQAIQAHQQSMAQEPPTRRTNGTPAPALA